MKIWYQNCITWLMFTCIIFGSKFTHYVPFHIMKYTEHIYNHLYTTQNHYSIVCNLPASFYVKYTLFIYTTNVLYYGKVWLLYRPLVIYTSNYLSKMKDIGSSIILTWRDERMVIVVLLIMVHIAGLHKGTVTPTISPQSSLTCICTQWSPYSTNFLICKA